MGKPRKIKFCQSPSTFLLISSNFYPQFPRLICRYLEIPLQFFTVSIGFLCSEVTFLQLHPLPGLWTFFFPLGYVWTSVLFHTWSYPRNSELH